MANGSLYIGHLRRCGAWKLIIVLLHALLIENRGFLSLLLSVPPTSQSSPNIRFSKKNEACIQYSLSDQHCRTKPNQNSVCLFAGSSTFCLMVWYTLTPKVTCNNTFLDYFFALFATRQDIWFAGFFLQLPPWTILPRISSWIIGFEKKCHSCVDLYTVYRKDEHFHQTA